jgi:hypothetical protein
MAYMAWSVGLSIFLSYHTDTELITETTHDWYEHAVIAGCICPGDVDGDLESVTRALSCIDALDRIEVTIILR